MSEVVVLLIALAALGVILYVWHGLRQRRLMRERLAAPAEVGGEVRPELLQERPFLQRHYLLPWLAGALIGLSLYYFAGLPRGFSAAAGVIVGLLGGQLEALVASRKRLLIETQLGDAIDLMVASLRAGASVMSALESAALEARRPLKPQLEDILGRIRYGDDPQTVLRALVTRVPLEAFRLFAAALAVHWEVGGSLTPTLATVGRTIRDRAEIARRISSLTVQSRASIVAVLFVTGFIGLVMWRTDPERMKKFLETTLGGGLVTAAVLLQAVGIVWSAAISRVKY